MAYQVRRPLDPRYRGARAPAQVELSALDLTVFGVGVIIGTGIVVLTGEAANGTAGPAVALSFVVAAIACGLAALCYAELASTVPVAGSAYTFSYATLGELIAWIIGWDLILEFIIGSAVVAVGWSEYLAVLLETWYRFGAWMAIGFLIYFLYSRRNSRLAEDSQAVRTSR